MNDFLFRGSLKELDPVVEQLIELEAERQYKKLILIPSESSVPAAVREAMGSILQNLYAEGYPDEDTRRMTEDEILDYDRQLTHHRRYADPRYYKGVEYANVIEALARRRCAEVFATPAFPAERLFVNVQPLSGAPANNAVYTALLNPGDTLMGMNLLHGGHLTHGSSVNRSGKLFKVVHYDIDPVTEQIDYDVVEKLAVENRPKIIVAGYSSYSWAPDWERFRAIADLVGAYLMADISHISGLIIAGLIPSPVGYAHVITSTTHKTLTGPRGAVIITTDAALARKLDRAVFPGEQGGPHVNIFAALATSFKLARTDQFRTLQQQIFANCQAFSNRLVENGFRIVFGGTNTHLLNLDCKTIKGPDGTYLSGDMASRILDIAGLVVNRNTIPGDKTAGQASGIRMGTPWISQRGLREDDMRAIADIIADVLKSTVPYTVDSRSGPVIRAKVDFKTLEDAKMRVRALAEKAGIDYQPAEHGYPHFSYLDDQVVGESVCLELSGEDIQSFVAYAFSSDTEELQPGQSQSTTLYTTQGTISGVLSRHDSSYRLTTSADQAGLAAAWLRDLSDGYAWFDKDVLRRLPGPISIRSIPVGETAPVSQTASTDLRKPYFVGLRDQSKTGDPLPEFQWVENEQADLRRTALNETHRKLGARMVPFAGWEMPVQYTSILEEHLAVRQAAGLFDVSHMGVLQAEGPDARMFLDSVCGNDIGALEVGKSIYTHFLDPDANVIDDTLVYRRAEDKYLVVVNASNDEKDQAWLNAVRTGQVLVDRTAPWARAFGRNVCLRDLRNPLEGKDMLVDIALQGPKSREILLKLGVDGQNRKHIMALKRTELCEAVVGGFNLVVSRTGYTGEKMSFELFVHPDQVVELWDRLLKEGQPLGLKPCGLGARDSLRTEAGLPLYGYEMAGAQNLGVGDAGFGSFVKVYKPWFIGRDAFIAHENKRNSVVVRFRFTEKSVRMAHPGDPVVDSKGRVVGMVTSCAIDTEGYLTGQAYVEEKISIEGSPIGIFQGAAKVVGKPPADLKIGDRFPVPTAAVIVNRFPK